MERVTFYVDGFNFYYALRKMKGVDASWLKYYWVDFVKLFEQFLGPNQTLEKVIYFTASPLNPNKNQRQGTLFNANKLINGNRFEIVRGKYFTKTITCPSCKFAIPRPEEKRTDVNISVRMIGDCMLNKTDVVVLVSADSDLVPPIEFIQNNCIDKKVRVYFPPSSFCNDLKRVMRPPKGKIVLLEKNKLKFENSVMPDKIENDDKSKCYTIPEKWAK